MEPSLMWLIYSISLHWKQTDFLSQQLPIVNSFLSLSETLCSCSQRVLSGLSLCRSCACCCLCEFVCTFALFCVRRQLFSWGHLPPLTLRVFLPPLFHASLNLDGGGVWYRYPIQGWAFQSFLLSAHWLPSASRRRSFSDKGWEIHWSLGIAVCH